MFSKKFPLEFELKKEPVIWCHLPAGRQGPPGDISADILEIGPGNGDFLLTLAAQNPLKKIAAIEVREKRFQKIVKRLEKSGVQNVTLIWGNAKVILPHYFKNTRLEKIYILFPDPWPKRRHQFHRLLDEEFLPALAGFLKSGGKLILATDSKEYSDWIQKTARKITFLSEAPFERDFCETFFEKVWKKEGKSIHYFCFSRI
ncbi:MAG: tRNA (guanosine(46)-N7)-methyltransferase TrmB [Deltaproteobacteria bacterium]|nr:tRNA (guanosine(46)-N7)-methyltransferase TrmB [Deltaproteobacteria bacterium]